MNDKTLRGKRQRRSIHTIEERPISALRHYAGNARTHSKRQIRQLMDSITRFGFTNPVLIADDDTIVRRWETFTGKRATLVATEEPFEDVEERRMNEAEETEQVA